jgi:DNA-binding GntR family transcriptional regulator
MLPMAGGGGQPSAVGVLADRLAAALLHHEPGWRLPRHTALARRYNVSAAEIDAALQELDSRHLIRRHADGQTYRASPAEFLIGLPGTGGLVSYADPMGAELTCRRRQVSWRRIPEEIAWALRLPAAEPACVVRTSWVTGRDPAAFSMTYLPKEFAGQVSGQGGGQGQAGQPAQLRLAASAAAGPGGPVPDSLSLVPGAGPAGTVSLPPGRPAALHIEMQPPPPSIARSLRLSPGQPATLITVRFDDLAEPMPVALTMAVLRPDLFRVVVESPVQPADGRAEDLPANWVRAAEDWERTADQVE